LAVEIGGTPIRLRSRSRAFARILEERYAGFLTSTCPPDAFSFDIEVARQGNTTREQDIQVGRESGRWWMRRGDFEAEWNPVLRHGRIRQSANPYSIDTVLRVLHSLLLAGSGGFLVHSASAIRDGRAFLFAGLSGAGKTTISRLAPPGVTLLTDEISFVRRLGDAYWAYGTPFAGELAKVGVNVSAPIAALFLLAQGHTHRREPVEPSEAARALLRNILFFAEEPKLVHAVFQSACDFVHRVPVYRLVFAPDPGAWEMIE
jgi:hypothetical protein